MNLDMRATQGRVCPSQAICQPTYSLRRAADIFTKNFDHSQFSDNLNSVPLTMARGRVHFFGEILL